MTARSKVAAGAGCRINEHMHHTARDLSDDQWKVLNRLIPKPKRRSDGRGRPWKSRRSVLRHSVGAAHWRSLGRSSRGVPIISHLPSSLSAMGALWSDERNPGGACFKKGLESW